MPRKILYIDDDEGLRTLVKRGLGRDGIEVVGEPSGERGLAALTANPDIDVVALDLYMPAVLKPEAMRWRSALRAAAVGKPMAGLPPPSSVVLPAPEGGARGLLAGASLAAFTLAATPAWAEDAATDAAAAHGGKHSVNNNHRRRNRWAQCRAGIAAPASPGIRTCAY